MSADHAGTEHISYKHIVLASTLEEPFFSAVVIVEVI